MSDFDKEAEREKLREKFARDDQKRARTARMSELLLKGATMTNKHHDCGSPIFRWKGEEFCPSCQGAPGASTQEAATETQEAQTQGPESPSEPPKPDAEAENGTEAEVTESTEAIDDTPEPSPAPVPTETTTSPAPTSGGSSGSVEAARGSLERTLAAVAQRAESTEDLSRKRDYLAAAKEAAEALEAVRRAER